LFPGFISFGNFEKEEKGRRKTARIWWIVLFGKPSILLISKRLKP